MRYTMPAPAYVPPVTITLSPHQRRKLDLARGCERVMVAALADPYRVERFIEEATSKIAVAQEYRRDRDVEFCAEGAAEMLKLFCTMWDRIRREA